MTQTPGQGLALAQLTAIAAASGGGVRLGATTEPAEEGDRLWIELSVDCSDIDQREAGIRLRGRERLRIAVPSHFPYAKPQVYSSHNRWTGTPHVHWTGQLCLYQAASEWDPQGGMYGLSRRIYLWLSRAATGELDPDDAPLHPPVQYGRSLTLMTVNENTPVEDQAWVGFADLDVRTRLRVDITGWGKKWPSGPAALAILLPKPFGWEYPTRVGGLFDAVIAQGVSRKALEDLLVAASQSRSRGEPMHVVVGTPMRRGVDGRPRHHIAVWEIDAETADHLRTLDLSSDGEDLSDAREALVAWVGRAGVRWCYVSDNRPEIVIRRDDRSPVSTAFADRKVVIWGCGAIGGHVAEWVARAGAREIVLYDKDIVTAGVLVRQPFCEVDIGEPKAKVLADRLLAIRPNGDLQVAYHAQDVIAGPLNSPDWHEDADIVIDATAAQTVRVKLEAVRVTHNAAGTTVITFLFGHQAERGVAAVAPAVYSGGTEDVLRQAKIACCADANLAGFVNEFWPLEPRTEHFQPEPGCSDATFRGSAVEVASLAGSLLHSAAKTLVAEGDDATAHFHSLPSAAHDGRRVVGFSFPAAEIMADGVGDYELRLSASALADIRGWVARNDRTGDVRAETGGVLFGRRDETTRIVWIDSVIGPPPDSLASPAKFVCGTAGVPEAAQEREARSRGELSYLGMWHTHPQMTANASLTDVSGMLGLVASQDAREAVMLIVGGGPGAEELGGYVFNGDQVRAAGKRIVVVVDGDPVEASPPPAYPRDIGLALSGGGSRALAFHLGCLRALHDRGILPRVRVISGVSGGALMTALYGYGLLPLRGLR